MTSHDLDHLFSIYENRIIKDKPFSALREMFRLFNREREGLLKRVVTKCFHIKRSGFKDVDTLFRIIYSIEDGNTTLEGLKLSDG